MLVTGSCNWDERKGSFRTALMYNQYAEVYKGDIEETTSANYCMLQGILLLHYNIKIHDKYIK